MKLVYTHPGIILVAQARNALERAGIECSLRNEYAAGAMGELAPIDAWPELWILHDRDYPDAKHSIEQLQTTAEEPDWQCPRCASECPATFEWCWHCACERSGP